MNHVFEIHGVISGRLIKTIQKPAVVIDTTYGIVQFIGEVSQCPTVMQKLMARKKQEFVMVELPLDQAEVTKAFASSGYALALYRQQAPVAM